VPQVSVNRLVLMAELGVDGSLRGIRGVLPAGGSGQIRPGVLCRAHPCL